MHRPSLKSSSLIAAFLLSACDVPTGTTPSGALPPGSGQAATQEGMGLAEGRAAFFEVKQRVEPVAEQNCRSATTGLNCDFLIRIDPDRNAKPNAYQSLDRSGRPVITFTQSMLADIANRDEMAFVMSHEAAHHIRGHLERQHQNAVAGAVLLGGLAGLAGASAAEISNAQDLGAIVGARSYSKDFELEADELGALITARSGYSPSIGLQFFFRLPDPGDRFLGTHPANPERVRVVQQTIARYNLN